MHAILLASALVATPMETHCQSSLSASICIKPYVQTGTMIFSEGDCLAVRMFTKSPYTHVAAVVLENGEPYVYDSMNGQGVRKLTLERYCQQECPNTLHVYQPKTKFSPTRKDLFLTHLKSELGRPYGVKHHLTGKRAKGIHCAEYMMDTLAACRLMQADNPSKVSPDSLRRGMENANLYHKVLVMTLSPPPAQKEEASNWGHKMWIDTKDCSSNCVGQLRRWFACK